MSRHPARAAPADADFARGFLAASSLCSVTRPQDAVCDDPCHLVWQVNKIVRLDSAPLRAPRPLPARPAGESDSAADDFEDMAKSSCSSTAGESDSPATQGGSGLIGGGNSTSNHESPSPATRGGRGRNAPCMSFPLRRRLCRSGLLRIGVDDAGRNVLQLGGLVF